jgi:hypothetical protein
MKDLKTQAIGTGTRSIDVRRCNAEVIEIFSATYARISAQQSLSTSQTVSSSFPHGPEGVGKLKII